MNTILTKIDNGISRETMYRMVIYGLCGVTLAGTVFSALGWLHYSALGIIISEAILLAVCYGANKLFSILFDAQSNHESWLITALILTLILPPTQSLQGAAFVALGGLLAMASKYIVAYRHRHIFNPAAFAAVILTVTGWLPAIWWVGTPLLVIFSTAFGIVLLRKLRRYTFFAVFAAAAIIVALIVGSTAGQLPGPILSALLLSSPLIFFGTIMVTEPETMPSGKLQKFLYAGLVGALVSSQLHLGSFYATPELALIVGNVVAFAMTVGRYKQKIRLSSIAEIGDNLHEYIFTPQLPLHFIPGQYVELTLPHKHTDDRGNRRTFSIASAPNTSDVRFATKLFDTSSSFKTTLESLRKGDVVTLGQLNGEFTLPQKTDAKIVMIAGGIGITPFTSMVRDMIATRQSRFVVLFYFVSKASEFAYQPLWRDAEAYGVRVIPVLSSREPDASWTGEIGSLTPALVQRYIPELTDHHFYISGPHGLVVSYQGLLRDMNVAQSHIHSDHFSGY